MERTWPNVLTYVVVLNQEYNKWQPTGVKGTPPEHNLDVAFIHMLAGPLDYRQGGMRNVLPENYRFPDALMSTWHEMLPLKQCGVNSASRRDTKRFRYGERR